MKNKELMGMEGSASVTEEKKPLLPYGLHLGGALLLASVLAGATAQAWPEAEAAASVLLVSGLVLTGALQKKKWDFNASLAAFYIGVATGIDAVAGVEASSSLAFFVALIAAGWVAKALARAALWLLRKTALATQDASNHF